MDYNRVITDLNGLSAEAFLERVGAAFSVEPAASRGQAGAARASSACIWPAAGIASPSAPN